MSTPEQPERQPTREERLRPLELLGLAAAMAVFTGLAVLLVIRDPWLALLFAGAAFVVALVVLATIMVAAKPNPDEQSELEHRDHDDRA